jgi:hypothetical protein
LIYDEWKVSNGSAVKDQEKIMKGSDVAAAFDVTVLLEIMDEGGLLITRTCAFKD